MSDWEKDFQASARRAVEQDPDLIDAPIRVREAPGPTPDRGWLFFGIGVVLGVLGALGQYSAFGEGTPLLPGTLMHNVATAVALGIGFLTLLACVVALVTRMLGKSGPGMFALGLLVPTIGGIVTSLSG